MKYGQIVRETITVDAPLTEVSIDVYYDRSHRYRSSRRTPEEIDENLVHLYSLPVTEHPSYREQWAPDHEAYGDETSRQWVMVYRYMPVADPERAEALQELLDKH